jgi:hypothetical protein
MMKFRMLGIDHQELEDLIQDTSLKIYLALHTFNFNTNVPFEHYLNRLVNFIISLGRITFIIFANNCSFSNVFWLY